MIDIQKPPWRSGRCPRYGVGGAKFSASGHIYHKLRDYERFILFHFELFRITIRLSNDKNFDPLQFCRRADH
jgi:hypothetical protein